MENQLGVQSFNMLNEGELYVTKYVQYTECDTSVGLKKM
jgi:hypothetical protein